MAHGEQVAGVVQEALAVADVAVAALSVIGVGRGPGPFTGLRVGLAFAETLGWTLGLPVYGVCTLDVLAAEAVDNGIDEPFLVATDARRKEVYWASYSERGTRLDGPQVSRPADIATDLPVVGRGAVLYPDAFPRGCPPEHPSAGVLAQALAEERVEPLDPEPLYLRRPDAAEPGKRKRVS